MTLIADILRARLLPAIVAALGVSFIAAGLLTYTTGADADLFPFPSDGIAVVEPGDSPDANFDPSPGPSDDESPDPSAAASGDPSDDPSFDPSADPSALFVDPSASTEPNPSDSPIPSASGSFVILPSGVEASVAP